VTRIPLALTVNGQVHEVLVEPHRSLLDVLRGELGLTGTKENCLEAECGVCTVLLDGAAVNACIVLAVECPGRAITTIEGLAGPDGLHPLQQAFIDHGAVQCGYCIPGMILSAKAFLDEHPAPSEAEVREALAGNLCRCTGYQKIVQAVLAAAGTSGPTRGAAS
jgi:carbon-monoxide dehydrogenase small subunit